MIQKNVSAHFLSKADLLEVINLPISRNALIIGGVTDGKTATFILGDLSVKRVPWSFFEPNGEGLRPDPNKLKIIDNGLTVQFGKYEAAADAIIASDFCLDITVKTVKELLAERKRRSVDESHEIPKRGKVRRK